MSNSIPIIDISALRSGLPDGERAVAREIGTACRGIGFFYITGHGIAPETLANVFRSAQQFFSGPHRSKSRRTSASGRQSRLHQTRWRKPRSDQAAGREGSLQYRPRAFAE
jgi:isopenicillin N synthase-like dioxygenase